MNELEHELVQVGPNTYNLHSGGKGSWDYVNSLEMMKDVRHQAGLITQKIPHRAEITKKLIIAGKKALYGYWLGKKHRPETIQKISEKASLRVGIKNSQYGTCWMTNGQENKKVNKHDVDFFISLGYYKGRLLDP
jgi:hypothetical protein